MSKRTFNSPVESASAAREALQRLNTVLSKVPEKENIEVAVEGNDDVILLPRDVAIVLREVLANSSAGRSVGVIPMHAELTTQQAADLLNVSRPHIVKLMDEGVLPGHKVGTHRRIYAADVHRYQHERDIERRQAADDLALITDELGLYE
ncbi:helix-turn-helix domain-containing protein [Corynebacterium rouxii]|uniref:DNA-binding protein n=1 Tax=Corynebacterium rouxii TaxID=2719119 RepID=A0A6I8MGS2_9CORY|nr:helix-turn-helix domain-containing protein [Corynebacterium rouxii]MDT9409670.1 helix-turn-helix domain-containing protein [Corynebacterium rouxii]MDT9411904.1 helix-turn-helix domain-containing protein [Corynebacterium rouxii]VZH86273.1 DNA-binding protein [Corynebacterium rouxii]